MPESLKNITILIVEDDIDIQTFAYRVLELEGYRVLKAETGSQGLKLLHDNRVHLVLLDIRMPDTNGWSVLEQIKGDPEISAIPVIIFTVSVDTSQRDRAIAMGAADYLAKPITATRLKDTVANILKP
jgi:response regulator RpfG family c-di-GMP phosphodiesterase